MVGLYLVSELFSLLRDLGDLVVKFECAIAQLANVGLIEKELEMFFNLVLSEPLNVLETCTEIKRCQAPVDSLETLDNSVRKLFVV